MRLGDPPQNIEGTFVADLELTADTLEGHRQLWEEVGRRAATRDDLPPRAPADVAERAIEEIPELVGRQGRIVEIGPGGGGLLRALGDLRDDAGGPRYEVHGVDVAASMLELARTTVDGAENVHLHLGNGYDLGGFEDGSVDLVCAVHTLHFVPRRIALNYLIEAYRVLPLGGRLWLHLPSALRRSSLLGLHHLSQPHFAEHPWPSHYWGPFEAVALLRFCGFWVWSVSEELVVVAGKTGRAGGDARLAADLSALAVREAGLPAPG